MTPPTALDHHAPSWLVSNTYRARPAADPEAVDLTIEIVGICTNHCGGSGTGRIAVQVHNTGLTHTRARIPVAVYAERGAELELLTVEALTTRIPGRYSSDTLVLEVPMREVDGDRLIVRVDDDGTGQGIQPECNEDNNEALIDSLCN